MYPHGAPDKNSTDSGTGVAASQSVLWQLVTAGANGTPDVVNPSNIGGGYVGNAAGQDDHVIFSRTTPAGGGGTPSVDEWLGGSVPKDEDPAVYLGQTLFIRVFQSAAPVAGEWYFNSTQTIVAQDIDLTVPTRSPQILQGNTTLGTGDGYRRLRRG